jgi:hypothetical protein
MNNANLFNEFINSEDLELYKNNNIDNFTKYVTPRDLELIYDGIDKTDYTYMGVSRWMDLEYILDKLISKKMNNPRLIKLQGHWYVVDGTVPPIEGGVAIWCKIKPIFTNFIDYEKGICSASERCFGSMTVSFPNLETVMGSTNSSDGTPMLDESKFKELGIDDESNYLVEYTIRFKGDRQIAVLINGYVNILKAKKESK